VDTATAVPIAARAAAAPARLAAANNSQNSPPRSHQSTNEGGGGDFALFSLFSVDDKQFSILGLSGPSKSYAERLFTFPPLGPLDAVASAASEDIAIATVRAICQLDFSFFRLRFDRLTGREKDFFLPCFAVAGILQHSGDIAEQNGRQNKRRRPLGAARSSTGA
jgi:hypothetical protein